MFNCLLSFYFINVYILNAIGTLHYFVYQKLFKQFRCHTLGNQVIKKINSHNHEINIIGNLRDSVVQNIKSNEC